MSFEQHSGTARHNNNNISDRRDFDRCRLTIDRQQEEIQDLFGTRVALETQLHALQTARAAQQ